jgi:hypothetical protein
MESRQPIRTASFTAVFTDTSLPQTDSEMSVTQGSASYVVKSRLHHQSQITGVMACYRVTILVLLSLLLGNELNHRIRSLYIEQVM